MAIDQKELGRRIRRVREAWGMTQEEVAHYLGIPRSSVSQIENGKRSVSGIELSRLAYLFGKDIRSFVAKEASDEEDPLVGLFSLYPELSQKDVVESVRRCIALARELTNLERLLDINPNILPTYTLPPPRRKWEAIQQGERIAAEERRRLGLGLAPLPDVAALLELQGLRTAQVTLPEDISGVMLFEPQIGFLVLVNCEHHILNQRFSYVHEYCHVLVDRDQGKLVSRSSERDKLVEVRANAFAASFLMPPEAVRQFLYALGKGCSSRMEPEMLGEEGPVEARVQAGPETQDIQLYDVVQLAHYFGLNRKAACYRLQSLQLITDSELETLLEQDRAGQGHELEKLLGLAEPDHEAQRNEPPSRLLGLALEAFRQEKISQSKLLELAAMVDVSPTQLERAIVEISLDHENADLLLPET